MAFDKKAYLEQYAKENPKDPKDSLKSRNLYRSNPDNRLKEISQQIKYRSNPAIKSMERARQSEYDSIPENRMRKNLLQSDHRATHKMQVHENRIFDNRVISDRIGTKNELLGDFSDQYDLERKIARQSSKFESINKAAKENLYEVMPEVKGQYGSAQVGALAGAVLPIAVHYANQATHGEFNPLDIKSAGEGSDIVPRGPEEQQYDSLQEMYRQKKLQSLK